jgi:hypothetical protein
MTIATILATEGLRATTDTPIRYAVMDIMKAILGDDVHQTQLCAMYRKIRREHDLPQDVVAFRGGRPSPVCTAEQAETLLQLLPGRRAAQFRATGVLEAKAKRVQHLYVMKYDFDDSKVKIGTSHSPEQRRRCIEGQHDFLMETLCVFPTKGGLEKHVHKALKDLRSKKGKCKEWFKVPAKDAVAVVSRLLQAIEAEVAKESEDVRVDDA